MAVLTPTRGGRSPGAAAGLLALLVGVAAPSQAAGPGVVATKHNLSVSGPGEVRATSEGEVCIFCHAGHVDSLQGPLWNRSDVGQANYRPYESGSMSVGAGQPNGSTLLCLSCHDGTVAVGAIGKRERDVDVVGTAGGRLRKERGGLGTDLSGSHPVSVNYDAAAGRRVMGGMATWLKPTPDGEGQQRLLDPTDQVQCTSCHDPHLDPAELGEDVPPFWKGASFDDVCTSCHEAPLIDRGHDDGSMMPAGCGSCHVGHGVSGQPLLPAAEEDACLQCHGDSAGRVDAIEAGRLGRNAAPASIASELDKPSTHPVRRFRDVHTLDEDAPGAPAMQRHVECVDCHPIHGDPATSASTFIRQRGAWVDGGLTGAAEAEQCYACHGSGGDLPFGETDKSLEFAPSNESYHPVEAPLGKRDVPSLLSPWVEGDLMSCGDCHGSDDPDAPAGPHGSRNPWILKDSYEAGDGHAESTNTYQACYRCHSRSSILANDSFEGHYSHVVTYESSCYACHDSHGSVDGPGLVRFGKDFRYSKVLPSSSGRMEYDPTTGTCSLSCHGADHDPLGYP